MKDTLLHFFEFNRDCIGNWINAKAISRRFMITKRQLRTFINELRREGHPIMSGNKGYKLANNYAEIQQTIARIKSHALSELEIARAMEERTFTPQPTLV